MIEVTSQNTDTYYSRNREIFLERQRNRRKTDAYRIKRNAQDRARYLRDKTHNRGRFRPSNKSKLTQQTTYYNMKSHLKRDFSMSFNDYTTLLKNKLVCDICKNPETTKKVLSMDHNHKTGKLRGVLCSKCNSGLGLFKDDPTILQHAIEYLHLHKD